MFRITTEYFSKTAIHVGVFLLYLQEIAKEALKPPFRRQNILQQVYFIGNQSLGILTLTGAATGAVFGLQIGGIFSVFKAESMIGGATGIALATELAPLMTGFLLAGRAGSAMTAEIATMVVGEQIDALEAMGVSPIHYLVVPRVLASILIMPFLCGLFMFIGMVGVYLVANIFFEVDQGVFFEKLVSLVQTGDIIKGLRKMLVFSFVIAVISCRKGLKAKKGAEGVGIATTEAVVQTLLVLLLADFAISFLEVRWLS